MPAFFVATGFCSHFDKDLKSFLWKNIKTILLPCFILYYLNRYLANLNVVLFEDSSWLTWKEWIAPGLRTFIKEGGYYWFLSALFIAKILLYGIYKLIPRRYCGFSVVCCFVLGIVCHQFHLLPNVWFFQHAMILLLFLHIGHWGRKCEADIMHKGWLVMLAFLAIVLLLTTLGLNIPTVTREITVTLGSSPLFVLLSAMGTIMVWWISKVIAHNKLLEALGRESIVIYCFNYSTLMLVGNTVKHIMPQIFSGWEELLGVLLTIVTSVALLHGMGWAMNHKPLSVLLGRY